MIRTLAVDRQPCQVGLAGLPAALRDPGLDRIRVTAGHDLPAVLAVLARQPAGTAARLSVDLAGAPLPGQADLAAAAGLGVERFELGARPAASEDPLRLLALLRDGVEFGVAVSYHGDALDGIDADLSHLPRPGGDGLSTGPSWQQPHAYGRCFYRRGPGFLLAIDRRSCPVEYRYTLADADHLEAVSVLRRPTPLSDLAAAVGRAATELAELDLVAVHGGRGLLLPYRLRRWPMPVDSL